MKKVKYLAMLLAAGMFAACSDNLEDTGAGNAGGTTPQGETGYVNISLNLPTTSGGNTRANDNFDDGLAAEYNVNSAIIALFYGADEASATCRYAFQLNETDFQMAGSSTDNITSYYASGVRMITAPKEDENVYALAILNPTNDFTVNTLNAGYDATTENAGDAPLTSTLNHKGSAFSGIFSALNTDETLANGVSDITTKDNTQNYFLMTNAPIASAASFTNGNKPSNFTVTTLAPITVYNEKAYAEAAASDNPIYVERAVAKTTVKIDVPSGSTLTVPNGTVDKPNPYAGATVEFKGWLLQNTNKKYYPVRNTYTTTYDWNSWLTLFNGSEVNRFFGEISNPYRTYWGVDPNYTTDIKDDALAENFNIITIPAGQQPGETDGLTWNELGNNGTTEFAGKLVEYCAENTTDVTTMETDQLTGVLLKAKFKPLNGTDNDNLFMINNTSTIFVENGDHGFIAWATATLANSGNQQAYLADGETLSLKTNAVAGVYVDGTSLKNLLQIKTSSPESTKELNDAQVNVLIAEAGNNIKFYKGGVMYYYTTLIAHFGDTETPLGEDVIDNSSNYTPAKHLGRWGVLRNNWYELNIQSVSGPGEPTIPEIPDEEAPDKTQSYINCEINVLSWTTRQQNVGL